MKPDKERIKRFLGEIKKNSLELEAIIDQNSLKPESLALKACKYILIELAEAVSNTLQHILAKDKGIAVSGYIDTIVKGYDHGVLSKEMFDKLKPFLDFRNSLIHRYWTVDDDLLIKNILGGRKDFEQFIEEIENYINKTEA